MNRTELEQVLGRAAEALAAGESVTLAVVVGVTGSAYRRTGAAMAVGRGWTVGGVSAGCLEADVVLQARDVLEGGCSRTVEYDTGDRSPFGLGIGCGGRVRIAMVPFAPSEAARVQEMAASAAGDAPWEWALALGGGVEFRRTLASPDHLHLYGAGVDSEPIIDLASGVGFRVTLIDHRRGLLAARAYTAVRERVVASPGESGGTPGRTGRVFAVVKTHDLETDRGWLRALRDTDAHYIGLMGPRDRVAELVDATGGWDPRIRAPVGLDLGGEGPAAVALSVVAELRAVASERAGTPLAVGG